MPFMKTILITVSLAVALIGLPTAAHADDTPPLEPWTADTYGDPYLDCDAAVWLVEVEHASAEQIAPGEYGEPIVTTSIEVWSDATGGPGSDCPNWQQDEDTWEWSDTDNPKPPAPEKPERPEHPVKADDGVVWKLGING